MKIFIDTGKLEEIEKANNYGILDGVTMNPSLVKNAVDALKQKGKKVNLTSYIKHILKVAKGKPVSLEVISDRYEAMVKEGKHLYKTFNPVAKNVYIKIPVDSVFNDKDTHHGDGIKAIKTLTKSKIPINCTLIFTPEQALLAAKAGASFVSPFAGRIDDFIRKQNKLKFEKTDYFPAEGWIKRKKVLEDNGVVSGIDLVAQCVALFKLHNIKAKVLAASLRNARQVREAALVGADIATLPAFVIEEMFKHHKTKEGMINFTKDVVPEYARVVKGK